MSRWINRVDIEDVLDRLGIQITHYNSDDAYAHCPNPDHVDHNPSFHVAISGSRRGSYNCWGCSTGGKNFVDLVAKILSNIWDRAPNKIERMSAIDWLKDASDAPRGVDAIAEDSVRRRLRLSRGDSPKRNGLIWPPTVPVAGTEAEAYLAGRGVSLARAAQLGVRAVLESGEDLRGCLHKTLPGVLFPIKWGGEAVSWYIRAVGDVPSSCKGRYPPGVPLSGVFWSEGVPVTGKPAILVEGIFDAERVSRIIRDRELRWEPSNVLALLGGNLTTKHVRELRRFPHVHVLADGDSAGGKVARSVRQKFGQSSSFDVLPVGTDPGDAPEEEIIARLVSAGPGAANHTRIRSSRLKLRQRGTSCSVGST